MGHTSKKFSQERLKNLIVWGGLILAKNLFFGKRFWIAFLNILNFCITVYLYVDYIFGNPPEKFLYA